MFNNLKGIFWLKFFNTTVVIGALAGILQIQYIHFHNFFNTSFVCVKLPVVLQAHTAQKKKNENTFNIKLPRYLVNIRNHYQFHKLFITSFVSANYQLHYELLCHKRKEMKIVLTLNCLYPEIFVMYSKLFLDFMVLSEMSFQICYIQNCFPNCFDLSFSVQ